MSLERAMISYARRSEKLSYRAMGLAFGGVALVVAIIAVGVPAYAVLNLSGYPRGTEVRPMGLGMVVALFVIAGWAAVPLGVACVALGWKHWLNWAVGTTAVLLGASNLWLCRWLFAWVVEQNGYIVSG
jgi:hypothetical protein